MLGKVFWALYRIRNYERIPKLPRGLLSSEFTTVEAQPRRVLARLGARDPRGVKVAMRRAGVATVEELAERLEHQIPRHRFWRRLNMALGRLFRSVDYDPHRREILEVMRSRKPTLAQLEAADQLKRVKREVMR